MDNYHNKFHFDNLFAEAPMTLDNFTVFQTGDLYCEHDTFVDEHEQFYHELSFIESGKGTFYTNNIPTDVAKGDIYLSFKNDFHKIKSDASDPLRYYYIAFDAKENTVYDVIVKQLQQNYHSPKQRLLHIPEIFPIMANILGEFSLKNTYYVQMFESYIIQILISLKRYTKASEKNSPISVYEKNKKYFVYNLVNYIDNNITEIDSLNDLAKIFSFDYSYMANSFKSIIGQPIRDYVQQKKMERAQLLLIRDKKSVTEVAEILHYSSINNFSRAFKSYFGFSPQQYKNMK